MPANVMPAVDLNAVKVAVVGTSSCVKVNVSLLMDKLLVLPAILAGITGGVTPAGVTAISAILMAVTAAASLAVLASLSSASWALTIVQSIPTPVDAALEVSMSLLAVAILAMCVFL